MNILIFSPIMPDADFAGSAHALAAFLTQAGHPATLVTGGLAADAEAVLALAVQADLVVYQLGDSDGLHAGTHAWLARLPGVLWLCGTDATAIAHRYGPYALGLLVPANSDVSALLPCCPGPVLRTDEEQAGATLLRLGQSVQGAAAVRAAVDAMAAVLRGWGADEHMVCTSGLAEGFDLFGA